MIAMILSSRRALVDMAKLPHLGLGVFADDDCVAWVYALVILSLGPVPLAPGESAVTYEHCSSIPLIARLAFAATV